MTIDTAMLLAAGYGRRLRPLSDRLPKPLLHIAGRSLLDHHLDRLAASGVRRVVINLHHLGAQIRKHLATRADDRLEVLFSEEAELLETAGGIQAALPLLGDAPFLVVNGDVFCDFDLTRLCRGPGQALAHLVLVPVPPWAAQGDFNLDPTPPAHSARLLHAQDGTAHFTYAGISVHKPALFAGMTPGPLPLRPLLDAAITSGQITGEVHTGIWENIGTLSLLEQARRRHGP